MKYDEQIADIYFKVFQEVIEYQSQSLISSLLQEIKTGLYECMSAPNLRLNEMEGINKSIYQIKAQLKQEQESSKILKDKFDQVEERMSRRLKIGLNDEDTKNLELQTDKFTKNLSRNTESLEKEKSKSKITDSIKNIMNIKKRISVLHQNVVNEVLYHTQTNEDLENLSSHGKKEESLIITSKSHGQLQFSSNNKKTIKEIVTNKYLAKEQRRLDSQSRVPSVSLFSNELSSQLKSNQVESAFRSSSLEALASLNQPNSEDLYSIKDPIFIINDYSMKEGELVHKPDILSINYRSLHRTKALSSSNAKPFEKRRNNTLF